jgi:hypothetical protein
MKRTVLLSLVALGLALGVSAEAGNRAEVLLKPGGLVGFRAVHCKATVTTYPVLTCVNGKYEVAVSADRVIVVRGRDGRVIFHTPY